MSRLSANTLFHFTPRQYLLDKFERGFAPRYNQEFDPDLDGEFFNRHNKVHNVNLKTGEEKIEKLSHHPTYIPMVCFCDIPMSSLEFHMSVYGKYGIGLRKEWGEEQALNPVMYVNENSTFFRILSGLFMFNDITYLMTNNNVVKELKLLQDAQYPLESIINIVELLRYSRMQAVTIRDLIMGHLKPRVSKGMYRGKFENYSYYDEKEWRYVPHLTSTEIPQFVQGQLSIDQLDDLNYKVKDKAITFKADMVKYIIVEKEGDIDFVINGLRDIKRRTGKFTEEDINLLVTKIITSKQIREDF